MSLRGKIRELKVKKAIYIDGYRLSIMFNDGKNSIVDFKPFLQTQEKGYMKKYINENNFKSFHIQDGNLVWGDNWDLIFPIRQLYKGEIKL